MSTVPVGAILLERETGILPTGPLAGQNAVIELWRSMSSQGYKTNYAQVPTYWLVIYYGARRFLCRRYSATDPKRTEIARQAARAAYESNLAALRNAIRDAN